MVCSEFSMSELIPRITQNEGLGKEARHPGPLSRAPETRPRGNQYFVSLHLRWSGTESTLLSLSSLCLPCLLHVAPKTSARLVKSFQALPRPAVAST